MRGQFSFLMGFSMGSFYQFTCRVKRVKRYFEKSVFWDRLLATTPPWWSLLRNPLSGSTLLARLATLQPTCVNMYPSFSIDSCCGETGAVTKHLLETISVRIIWFCWRPCKAETAELQVAASAGNAWPAHHLQCTCRATTYHNIPYHTKSYHTMPYRRALY